MIRSERRGAVALWTLDRPERRNAVDTAACVALREEIDAAAAASTRVGVLTGAGGHFCSGADLGEVRTDEFRTSLRALLDGLVAAPFPIIAAIDGVALGAGMQLAVAADLRVATAAARFGIPAGRLGVVVDHWTVRRVASLAGAGPARAMLLAAEEIPGDVAHSLGLVQRLGGLEDAVTWAQVISELAPLSVAGHKLALNRVEAAFPEDAEVTDAWRSAWASADLSEGMTAFRERRPPRFEGR